MKLLSHRYAKIGVMITLFMVSSKGFSACTEQDIPLGSGNISTGTSLSNTIEDQEANRTGSGDGTFTYSFNSNGAAARCGRHADGTWWIAPASGQAKVELSAITSNFAGSVKAQANPDPAARGFLNNAENYRFYDGSKNIIPSLPTQYPLNNDFVTSIFSAIQRSNLCGTSAIHNECIEFANFLTVYNSPPVSGGKNTIRPTLFGTNKRIYTWDDFDRSRIPSISGADWNYDKDDVLSLISKWTATTEGFSIPVCDNNRTNCSHVSEGGRAFRSHAVIDDYASGGLQNRVLSYLLGSSSDVINDAEDAALLAAVIAYGVDIITLLGNPPSSEKYMFSSGAGQFMNAANFSYFAAALSQRDGFLWNTMAVEVRSWLDSPIFTAPQEIQQIYDAGDGPLWGDANPGFDDFARRRYWTELKSGMAHDNSDNWYVFTTPNAGTTFQIKDDTTGAIIPPLCNFGSTEARTSYCRSNVVIVGDTMLDFWSHTPNGSNIILDEPVPAGTVIQVSAITESWQGSNGGNRAFADPHGYIDGPPGVPGFGYFTVSTAPRIEWAGIAQAIPELCEVINSPNLIEFVERYFESGLRTGNDPCAPPSIADLNNGNCDVWRTSGCVDYGLSNNGTVRWGPDPRNPTQCVANNTVLTLQNNSTWAETTEERGDNGRFARFNGIKLNNLPKTYTDQYIAFKGNRDCVALLSAGGSDGGGSDGGGSDGGQMPSGADEMCVPLKTAQGKVTLICL